MKTYFRQRLLLLLPTLVGMTALVFALGFISPSDPAAVIMTMDGVTAPSPEEIAAKRVELGLDRPYAVQYAAWLGGVLRGDWGVSFITGKNVLQELLQALPVTLSLAGMALLWVILLSVPLGAVMAVYRHGAAERWLTLLSIALTSLPSFWLAIVLMQILCENLRIFPTSGYGTVRHLLLPGLVLGAGTIGAVMRLQRDALTDVLAENYILTARAKGLPLFYIVYRHALRNAFIATATMLGNYAGALLGGAAIIELIFALPGLGTLALTAVQARDYPMIQGYVLMVGCMMILVNLCVDVFYVMLKPNLRLGDGQND